MRLEISQRQRVESALRESEQRLRVVTQTAGDAIVSVDNHGQIILWNNAAERMFGYLAAEAIGKPLSIIIPERLRQGHSEAMGTAIAAGKSRLAGRPLELIGVHKCGTEFPLELSIAF